MNLFRFLFLLFLIPLYSCQGDKKSEQSLLPIEKAILEDSDSFYYIDFNGYSSDISNLPIGVFDSGTGGLTILDALIRYDGHENDSGVEGSDGTPDFRFEKFIYLADQANMPYGNYFAENKSHLLKEHIIKDIQFLLGDKYYNSSKSNQVQKDKERVKAIVVACNTATAYGYKEAEDFLQKAGLNIPIIGVINAASRGAFEKFRENEDGSIGVFATVGTIGSEGYERTLKEVFGTKNHKGNVQIFNQGGHGVAEAVDEEPDYINPQARVPQSDYRGPSLDHSNYPIDRTLMDIYNFNFDSNNMLCDTKDTDACQILQINSSENYVRYHLVSLMEQIRKSENAPPLKVLVLGCTHYPYLISEIYQVIDELKMYTDKNGNLPYKSLISDDLYILDPAEYVAKELYEALKDQELMRNSGDVYQESEFYISMPNLSNPNVVIDTLGRFTYDYKYGRTEGEVQEYVKIVPFDKQNVSQETWTRVSEMIPETYKAIQQFHKSNPKLFEMPIERKIL